MLTSTRRSDVRWLTLVALVAITIVAGSCALTGDDGPQAPDPIPAPLLRTMIEGQVPRGMMKTDCQFEGTEDSKTYRASCGAHHYLISVAANTVQPADDITRLRWNRLVGR